MKRNLLLFFLAISSFCFSQSADSLLGKWSGKDGNNKIGAFTFFPDNYVAVEIDDMFIDGRNYIIPAGPNKGKKAYVKYIVDYSVNPNKLIINAFYKDGNDIIEESQFLNGLIEFVGKNQLMIQLDFDKENLKKIDPSGKSTLVLNKVEELKNLSNE
ncbi:hypothetical protein NZ698_05945 [Chryseobacterium sp. PBS4-4]|uniref:DUF4488 domain-containing protein n=1 Tax=Chryseobacterium edaphi TaxID=2976532 RepID=A0ABT2W3E5_9FLAO|nr:hypothetical protein [Chryseobacterium edaphi]MCU7616732.1 hypothetical protein [Chryseobacterium edaphi]